MKCYIMECGMCFNLHSFVVCFRRSSCHVTDFATTCRHSWHWFWSDYCIHCFMRAHCCSRVFNHSLSKPKSGASEHWWFCWGRTSTTCYGLDKARKVWFDLSFVFAFAFVRVSVCSFWFVFCITVFVIEICIGLISILFGNLVLFFNVFVWWLF